MHCIKNTSILFSDSFVIRVNYLKEAPFFDKSYTKGLPFFCQNGIQKGKELDLGGSLPV